MLHVALVHYPTVDRTGAVVATSITNLDMHDLSRAARTYGVEAVWLVHPHEPMRRFCERVILHWTEGWGAAYNPTRRESLVGTHLVEDLGEVARRIEAATGRLPTFTGTSAKPYPNSIGYAPMREIIAADPEQTHCLVFGTGWGLHPEVMLEMDHILEPIHGVGDWNHLSVRSAVSIILDRLLSPDR